MCLGCMAKYSSEQFSQPGNPAGKAGTPPGTPGKSLIEVLCNTQDNNGGSHHHHRGAIAKRSSSGLAGNTNNSNPRITLRHGEERGIVCYVFQVMLESDYNDLSELSHFSDLSQIFLTHN